MSKKNKIAILILICLLVVIFIVAIDINFETNDSNSNSITTTSINEDKNTVESEVDYKAELEICLQNLDVSIEDISREIEQDRVPEDSLDDSKERVKALLRFYEKYMGQYNEAKKQENFNYRELYEDFREDLNTLYDSINMIEE